jgi:hypothetical protein
MSVYQQNTGSYEVVSDILTRRSVDGTDEMMQNNEFVV